MRTPLFLNIIPSSIHDYPYTDLDAPPPRIALADRSNDSSAVSCSEACPYPYLPSYNPGHPGDYRAQMVAALTRAKAEVGLAPDATSEQVRDAFRNILKDAHPDCGGDLDFFRTFLSCWESAQRLFALVEGEGKSRPSVKSTCAKESHVALPARVIIITEDVEAEESLHDDESQSGSATGSDSSLPPFPASLQRPRTAYLANSTTLLAHFSVLSSQALTACAVPLTDEDEEAPFPPSFPSLPPPQWKGRAASGLTKKRQMRTTPSLGPSWAFPQRKPPLLPQRHNKSNQSMPAAPPPIFPPTSDLLDLTLEFGVEEAVSRAGLAYDKEEFLTAVQLYSLAMALKPRDAEITMCRAAAQFARGLYPQALSDAQRASRLQPTWPTPFYRAGLSHKAMGDHEAALAEFRTALGLEPAPSPRLLALAHKAGAVLGEGREGGPLIGHGCAVASVAVQPTPVLPNHQKVGHSKSGDGSEGVDCEAVDQTPSPSAHPLPLLVSRGENGGIKVWDGGSARQSGDSASVGSRWHNVGIRQC